MARACGLAAIALLAGCPDSACVEVAPRTLSTSPDGRFVATVTQSYRLVAMPGDGQAKVHTVRIQDAAGAVLVTARDDDYAYPFVEWLGDGVRVGWSLEGDSWSERHELPSGALVKEAPTWALPEDEALVSASPDGRSSASVSGAWVPLARPAAPPEDAFLVRDASGRVVTLARDDDGSLREEPPPREFRLWNASGVIVTVVRDEDWTLPSVTWLRDAVLVSWNGLAGTLSRFSLPSGTEVPAIPSGVSAW